MIINDKAKKGLLLTGLISILLALGIVIFTNPSILVNLIGGTLNTAQTFSVENGLETETGVVEDQLIILAEGDKQTGPNVTMLSGQYKIEYHGDNFADSDISVFVQGNQIDLEQVEITNTHFEFEVDIKADLPVNIELHNHSEQSITIEKIVVTRINAGHQNEQETDDTNGNNEVSVQEENEPVEINLEEPYRVVETITFMPHQLRFEGNGIKNNENITLRPGAMQLGPSMPLQAGTYRVTYYGVNLRSSDITSAFQFDPYIVFDKISKRMMGNTLTYIMVVPVNITSLELLYQNTQTRNVVVNRIVVERLGN